MGEMNVHKDSAAALSLHFYKTGVVSVGLADG